jgi:hypothetical protein
MGNCRLKRKKKKHQPRPKLKKNYLIYWKMSLSDNTKWKDSNGLLYVL